MTWWQHVLIVETYLYPSSRVAITHVTVLGRWTWKRVRQMERPR